MKRQPIVQLPIPGRVAGRGAVREVLPLVLLAQIDERQNDDRQAWLHVYAALRKRDGIGARREILPLLRGADKATALTGHGPNQILRRAAVADRLAHRVDPAGHCRFGHDPAAPDRLQQVVPADDAVAVLHQVNEKVEDLRFERDQLAAPPEFAPIYVKYMIATDKPQIRSE